MSSQSSSTVPSSTSPWLLLGIGMGAGVLGAAGAAAAVLYLQQPRVVPAPAAAAQGANADLAPAKVCTGTVALPLCTALSAGCLPQAHASATPVLSKRCAPLLSECAQACNPGMRLPTSRRWACKARAAGRSSQLASAGIGRQSPHNRLDPDQTRRWARRQARSPALAPSFRPAIAPRRRRRRRSSASPLPPPPSTCCWPQTVPAPRPPPRPPAHPHAPPAPA